MEVSFGQQLWTYLTYLATILLTYGNIRVYDRANGFVDRGAKQFVSMASQTETTYTEVRGVVQPRFRVLPEHNHG